MHIVIEYRQKLDQALADYMLLEVAHKKTISAAIEVGGEDFLGREQQLSAPRSSTSHLPQARYIHIRGVKRGGAVSRIAVPEARKQELT